MTIPALAILLVMDAAEVNNIILLSLLQLWSCSQVNRCSNRLFPAFSTCFLVSNSNFLAVLGAFLLGEWFESVIVTGLVALASYIEERTFSEARNAMQEVLTGCQHQRVIQIML